MKLALMILVALGSALKVGLAAPTSEESVETTPLPQPPSATVFAKSLGFPASVHFKVTTSKVSATFEDFKPLLVTNYSSERQTPYTYALEIYPVGSLFGAGRQSMEEHIEKSSNDLKKMEEEYRKKDLIKHGRFQEGTRANQEYIKVETRPDGRKVFFTAFAVGPGGGVLGAFTSVGKYDLLFLQYAFGGDGDDPEETERVRRMAVPNKSLTDGFAQLERSMPIFPPESLKPILQPIPPSVAISGGAVPRQPTGTEFASCLDLLKPVKFVTWTAPRSPIFGQFKPIWVGLYSGGQQGSSGYSLEIYPAHSLFGSQRKWFEQYLEQQALRQRKAAESLIMPLGKEPSKPRPAPTSAVVTRPEGRKVYFHLFTMASGAEAPAVFSTIGDYDVVLTQYSYSTDADELVARKKVAPRLGMFQAFAKLEPLLKRMVEVKDDKKKIPQKIPSSPPLGTPTHSIDALTFSPDGRRLATGNEYGCIQVWQTSDGKCLQTLQKSEPSVRTWSCKLAFSPDGKILAGTNKSTLSMWSQPSGRLLRTIRVKEAKITSVAFSPDGESIAIGTGTNTLFEGKASISLWRVKTGQLQSVFKENMTDVATVAFSPNGRTLAVSCAANIGTSGKPNVTEVLRLLNLKTKKKEWEIHDAEEVAFGELVFTRDGKVLALGGTPPLLLNAKNGKPVATLERRNQDDCCTWHIAFSPDEKILIDTSFQTPPKFWDTKTGEPIETEDTDSWESISAAFSPLRNRLARGDSFGMVRLWDTSGLNTSKIHLKQLMTINTVTRSVVLLK